MTSFKEANDRFMKRYNKMTEKEKNRLANVEYDISEAEEKVIKQEAKETIKRLEKKGVFARFDAVLATRKGYNNDK